jgi:hypothetical protein
MQRLLALLLTLSLNLGLPAADPSGKVVEFPAAPKTKADQTAQLVFAISTSKEIEIISLDPILRIDKNKKAIPPSTAFHGFAILSTARITDTKEIQRLAESLGKAIDAGKSSALCFSPRHALRIARPDGPLDIVVCFECSGVQLHGFTGLSYSALAPEPAQKIWESIFTAHLPKKS